MPFEVTAFVRGRTVRATVQSAATDEQIKDALNEERSKYDEQANVRRDRVDACDKE